MTRKDYELLAKALANAIDTMKEIPSLDPRVIFIENIGYALEGDNPRFDRLRFTRACWETPATIRARREEITAQLA